MKCPNCVIDLKELEGKRLLCTYCGFNTSPGLNVMASQFIWLAVDSETGNEGAIGVNVGTGIMAAMNSDKEVALKFVEYLKKITDNNITKLRLVEFVRGSVVMEL